MPGWTLVNTHPAQGRIFQRPLDTAEKAIYLLRCLDGLGSGDVLFHYEIHLKSGSPDVHLFSEANIVKAWLSTKRRYPLAAALVRGADGMPLQLKVPSDSEGDQGLGIGFFPHFVVQEHDLASLRPGEVIFGSVNSAEEARKQAATALRSRPPIISDDLLMQLRVLRRIDADNVLDLMILFGHHNMDATAGKTFVRCLLDTLAWGEGVEVDQLPLEDRLAMAVPAMDAQPAHLRSLSPAIRRWRRAVGMLIFQRRMTQMQGGHTLPRRHTHSTSDPLSSSPSIASTSLTNAQTTNVLANCRRHGITFASAYSVLTQVAMTRVLYRRYLRGEISEEEWEYRKRQPHNSGADALNLRPYLDKTWFENGGKGEFVFSVGTYFLRQPSMAIGGTYADKHLQVQSDGAPPFSDLLTFNRFLHRSRLVRKQVTALVNHPLLLEIVYATFQAAIFHYMQLLALQSKRRAKAAERHEISADSSSGKAKESVVSNSMLPVFAYATSNHGNLDLTFPAQYPIPPTHPLSPYSSIPHPSKAGYTLSSPPLANSETDTTPKIVIKYWRMHGHILSGASLIVDTFDGQLSMHAHFNDAEFEDAVMHEWLDEIKGAVLWYLGGSEI